MTTIGDCRELVTTLLGDCNGQEAKQCGAVLAQAMSELLTVLEANTRTAHTGAPDPDDSVAKYVGTEIAAAAEYCRDLDRHPLLGVAEKFGRLLGHSSGS